MAYPLWWAEEGRPSEALRWVSILLIDPYFEILQSPLNGSHQMLRKACGCLTVKEVSMKPWLTRSKERKWVGTLAWKSAFTFSCLWQANVKVGWEEKTFKASQLMQVNPPKMEKLSLTKTCSKSHCLCSRFEDVSNMTYLNEASVLWNLKSRYVCKLIYVSWS